MKTGTMHSGTLSVIIDLQGAIPPMARCKCEVETFKDRCKRLLQMCLRRSTFFSKDVWPAFRATAKVKHYQCATVNEQVEKLLLSTQSVNHTKQSCSKSKVPYECDLHCMLKTKSEQRSCTITIVNRVRPAQTAWPLPNVPRPVRNAS